MFLENDLFVLEIFIYALFCIGLLGFFIGIVWWGTGVLYRAVLLASDAYHHWMSRWMDIEERMRGWYDK